MSPMACATKLGRRDLAFASYDCGLMVLAVPTQNGRAWSQSL